jgi:hypothetical protein
MNNDNNYEWETEGNEYVLYGEFAQYRVGKDTCEVYGRKRKETYYWVDVIIGKYPDGVEYRVMPFTDWTSACQWAERHHDKIWTQAIEDDKVTA